MKRCIIRAFVLIFIVFTIVPYNSQAGTNSCVNCTTLNNAMDTAKQSFIGMAKTINATYLDNTNSSVSIDTCLNGLETSLTSFSIGGILNSLPSLSSLLSSACTFAVNAINNQINSQMNSLNSQFSWSGTINNGGYISFSPGTQTYFNVTPPSANTVIQDIWGTIN